MVTRTAVLPFWIGQGLSLFLSSFHLIEGVIDWIDKSWPSKSRSKDKKRGERKGMYKREREIKWRKRALSLTSSGEESKEKSVPWLLMSWRAFLCPLFVRLGNFLAVSREYFTVRQHVVMWKGASSLFPRLWSSHYPSINCYFIRLFSAWRVSTHAWSREGSRRGAHLRRL